MPKCYPKSGVNAGWRKKGEPAHNKGVPMSVPIPTGSAYKLDFALRKGNVKINIEIDGRSHRGRVEQDLRRDTFLRSLGWKVIRIKT